MQPDFQSLFEGSPSLFLILTPDPSFTITAVTDAYAAATLTVREEILGKGLFEVFPDNPNDPHADGVNNLRTSLMTVLKTKVPHRMAVQKYDIPIPDSDTFEERYWSPLNTPVLDSAGNITSIIHQVTDVTHESLREIERQDFRSLFLQSPEIVVILRGPEFRYEFVNQTHINILGFDATGKNVKDVNIGATQVYEILQRVYSTGETARLTGIPVVVSGKERFFDLTYSAGKRKDGVITGIMVMGIEVTDTVKAREGLEKAIRVRDEFMSIASHELKTPLTSMKIQTQLFHRKYNDDKLQPMMRIMERGVERLIRLVDDMLDISRIELGKLNFHREPIELSQFLQETLEHFRDNLNLAGIELHYDLKEKITCSLDPFRIEQVITNLVTNAIRYAPSAPLAVSLHAENDFAVITFQDGGPGVPKIDRERVFVRFERLHTRSEISGMGLGLFICKEIIQGHGGTIKIRDSEVKGTCFIIRLPKA
ncbi:MAG: ATP-binding protein [Bdellovibrionota bacterium]